MQFVLEEIVKGAFGESASVDIDGRLLIGLVSAAARIAAAPDDAEIVSARAIALYLGAENGGQRHRHG